MVIDATVTQGSRTQRTSVWGHSRKDREGSELWLTVGRPQSLVVPGNIALDMQQWPEIVPWSVSFCLTALFVRFVACHRLVSFEITNLGKSSESTPVGEP